MNGSKRSSGHDAHGCETTYTSNAMLAASSYERLHAYDTELEQLTGEKQVDMDVLLEFLAFRACLCFITHLLEFSSGSKCESPPAAWQHISVSTNQKCQDYQTTKNNWADSFLLHVNDDWFQDRSFHAYHTACEGLHSGFIFAQRPYIVSGCSGFHLWLK